MIRNLIFSQNWPFRFKRISVLKTFYFYLYRYWNYLRKQTFVLESYISEVNRKMNRGLFSFHCYASWGFVAPFVMSGIHVAAALRLYFKGYSFGEATLPFTGECISCPYIR